MMKHSKSTSMVVAATGCWLCLILVSGHPLAEITGPDDNHNRIAPEVAPADQDNHPAIRPFLNQETEFVIWIDPQMVSPGELAVVETLPGTAPDSGSLSSILDLFRKHSVNRIYIVGGVLGVFTQQQLPVGIVVGGDLSTLAKELREHPLFSDLAIQVEDGMLVIAANEMSIQAAKQARGEPHADLLTSLAECAGNHGLAVTISPQVQSLLELTPESGEMLRLASGLKRISLSQNPSTRLLTGGLYFENAEQSRQFCDGLNQDISRFLNLDGTDSTILTTDGNRVTMTDEAQREFIPRLIAKMRESAAEVSRMNNLRQIVIAIHNFHDVYGKFPPQALTDAAGQRLLSWRVLILPYIGEMELYDAFRLDEPWDSEHNIKLLKKMPQVYASGDAAESTAQLRPGVTCYVAPMTAKSIFGRQGPLLRFPDITDGLSNTIMLVECNPENAVPWSKPEDVVIDSANPLVKLNRAGQDYFIIAIADGAIQKLPADVAPEFFQALLTINGGEVINWNELRDKK